MNDENRSENIAQELYCTKSGGGCGGYWTVCLRPGLNCLATMVCPNCGHEHQRKIINGKVTEDGRFNGTPTERITAFKEAFSEKPLTDVFIKGPTWRQERDGVIDEAQRLVRERWFEIHGAKQ